VEAWTIGGVLYTVLAGVVARTASRERLLGFPREASAEPPVVPTIDDTPVAAGAAERR